MSSVSKLSVKDFRHESRRTAFANTAQLGEHGDRLSIRYLQFLCSDRRALLPDCLKL